MKSKFLFLTILMLSFFIAETFAESDISTKIEAGLFSADMKGDINNPGTVGPIDFSDNLGYSKFNASYFSVEVENNYEYVPNVYFGFFNMQQNANSTLDKDIEIAAVAYDSGKPISSSIDYYVLNFLLYENLMIKGSPVSIFGQKFYPGDLEFRIGADVKYINWQYHVMDKSGLSSDNSWIKVNEFIPLPFLGFRYYRYKFSAYGNISAISFDNAKSVSVEAGVDYRIVEGLHLSVGYIYENFDILEDDDMVYYQIDGVKLGFKYVF